MFLLIQSLSLDNIEHYADEKINDNIIKLHAKRLVDEFFSMENGSLDNFDGMLIDNIIKILRHIAQNVTPPQFIDFMERDEYDLDALVRKLDHETQGQILIHLRNMYNDSSMYWKHFYKSFHDFKKAYDASVSRVHSIAEYDKEKYQQIPQGGLEVTDKMRNAVFTRDKATCLCCGKKKRRGVKLVIDHIIPVSMSGENDLSNLQTLCNFCNSIKGVNEIDFRKNKSPLRKSRDDLQFYAIQYSDDIENVIARIVNEFYYCQAMLELQYHIRSSGSNYNQWNIVLYPGNNPEWLTKFKTKLLTYIQEDLGYSYVTRIDITH
jgi:5-methylcytosine-specific restriction endonuclease McrA